MDYTLAGLRNRVKIDKLDDPGYESSVIDNFINDAQREIFNTNELYFAEKIFKGTLPTGETSFILPSDLVTPQMLILIAPDNSVYDITQHYMGFRDFFQSHAAAEFRDAARPSVWTLHGKQMYISTPTDQQYILKTLYLKSPALLVNDTDVPETPEDFSEALILGALYRCQLRNEDYDIAAGTKAEFLEMMDSIIQRLGKRQVGKTLTMGQPNRMVLRRR